MRYLYTILFYLATPLLLLRFYWKGRHQPLYRQRLAERFGFVPRTGRPSLWVHAVSLGESIAATPLIRALKQQYPDYALVITCTTATGYRYLADRFGESILLVYAPLDLPDVIHRFRQRTQAKKLIILETELWPNWLYAMRGHVIIANARLSERAYHNYCRIKPLISSMLKNIFKIAAQTTADKTRYINLGATKNQVDVTGNLKFDLDINSTQINLGAALRRKFINRPVWIAASTHDGEENIIFAAHKEILKTHPNTLLILAPRHPERFNTVYQLGLDLGFTPARRSRGQAPDPNTSVYLADSLGELFILFAASDMAFMGGSLVPIGGHNFIEPASLGLPLVSGPYLTNFQEIADQLIEAEALKLAPDANTLADIIIAWIKNPEERQKFGARALAFSEKNRGALEKQLRVIHDAMIR
jgi:3-deoxy-D-manno-octulosonic-acid transferase